MQSKGQNHTVFPALKIDYKISIFESEEYKEVFDNKWQNGFGPLQVVKDQVMPFLKSVDLARQLVDESNNRIGDILDPEKEQADADCAEEGVEDHPDHFALDPGELLESEKKVETREHYKTIEIGDEEELIRKRVSKVGSTF